MATKTKTKPGGNGSATRAATAPATRPRPIGKEPRAIAAAMAPLADPCGVAILGMLAEGGAALADIAARTGLKPGAAAKLLSAMKSQEWAEAYREAGQGVWQYRISAEGRRVYEMARKVAGVG